MDNKQDEFEDRKPIEPIPGQMCYDEFLLPESEEEKEIPDTSVAIGQMDFWSVSAQPKVEEKKDVKKTSKLEISNLEKKSEIEEEIGEKLQDNFKQTVIENPQEKSVFEVKKEIESLEEEQEKHEKKTEVSKVFNEKGEDESAFNSPKKLRKTSVSQNDFVEKKSEEIVEISGFDEEHETPIEEDETEHVDEEELQIDFENPPKKLEKTEIYASKSHFFGNYENPFDE